MCGAERVGVGGGDEGGEEREVYKGGEKRVVGLCGEECLGCGGEGCVEG